MVILLAESKNDIIKKFKLIGEKMEKMIERIMETALGFIVGMTTLNILKGLCNSRKNRYVILRKIDQFIFGW